MTDATFEITSEIINHVISQAAPQDIKDDGLLPSADVPSWLSESYVEKILRKFNRDDNLRVKFLQIKQCGGKGDSYASMMYRVGCFFYEGKCSETLQSRSLIIKTLPVLDLAIEKLGTGNYNVQTKEMDMYQQVLPEFKEILESINEDSNIFPLVLTVDKSLDVIVLEDLMEKKYVMADRLKGLDMNHVLMALRKLARMHACSIVVDRKDPKVLKKFDTGFFTRKTDAFHIMFESLCDAMIEEVSTWNGYEYYAEKLKNVRKNLIKNAQRAFDCDEGDLQVLTHGDLWTNNLMFQYNESGFLTDCVLIDFQFTSMGSPALDLIVRAFFKLSRSFS